MGTLLMILLKIHIAIQHNYHYNGEVCSINQSNEPNNDFTYNLKR